MEERVLQSLRNHIPESETTVMYLHFTVVSEHYIRIFRIDYFTGNENL